MTRMARRSFSTPLYALFVVGFLLPSLGLSASDLGEARRVGAHFATFWASGDVAALEDLWMPGALEKAVPLERILGSPGLHGRWIVRTIAPDEVVLEIVWPSGLWELARLRLAEGEGGPRITKIEALGTASVMNRSPSPPSSPTGTSGSLASPPEASILPGSGWLVAGGALLLLGLAVRSHRGLLLGLGAAVLVVGAVLPRLAGGPGPGSADTPSPESASDRAPGDGGSLSRDALALDPAGEISTTGGGSVSAHPQTALWLAIQLQANSGNPKKVEGLLAGLPPDFTPPARDLIDAWTRAALGEDTSAAVALERLEERLPAGHPVEPLVASTWEQLEFPERAEVLWERLEANGLDEPSLWFRRARHDTMEDSLGAAENAFRRGWTLRPRSRADLLQDPVLAWLLSRSPTVREIVAFDGPAEPVVECGQPAQPLEGLVAQDAWTSGDELAVWTGAVEIVISRGCGLADESARALNARQAEETRLGWWLESATSGLRGPLLVEVTTALARASRWEEILDVVGATSDADPIPADALRLRALALQKTGRVSEALPLLASVAQMGMQAGAPDPGTQMQLAEQLLDVGERASALRVLELADRRWPRLGFDRRLLQVRIEDRLSTRALQMEVGRYRLSYPPTQDPWFVQRVGRLLEAEEKRLARWIPPGSGRPIRVLFLTESDFREAYGGGGPQLLGLWDGMVRVPYGGMSRLEPEMVSVLTHELAHALIADVTSDRAPAWLHEGLAQHVQLLQPRSNPVIDPHRRLEPLPFPLIDPVLQGPPHPELTSMAYEEALWAIHFVEQRFGVEGIRRLVESAGTERSADELLRAALDLGEVEFHQGFFAWAHDEAPRIWPLDRATLAAYLPPPPPGPASEAEIEAAILEGLAQLLAALFEN